MPWVQKGYRAAASRYSGGFQSPRTSPVGTPANDNRPWNFPKPANDNAPARISNPATKGARAISPSAAAKLGGRVLPLVGAVITGIEAFDAALEIAMPLVPLKNFNNPIAGYNRSRENCYEGPGPYNVNKFGGQTFLPSGDNDCSGAVQFLGPKYTANPFADGYHWVGYITQASLAGGYATDSWIRNAGDPSETPLPTGEPGEWVFPYPQSPVHQPAPNPNAVPLPWVYPALDPLHLPIHQPLPTPRPLPVRWPLPPVDPINPQSPKRTEPARLRARPRYRPSVRPNLGRTVWNPRKQKKAGRTPPYRSKPRDNETKVIGTPASTSLFMQIVNGIGEAGDFVEAFHSALPQHLQRHRAGQIFDAIAVIEHFDQIDGRQALKNLIANEIDDQLYGRVGRIQARSNREQGRVRGPRIGPAGGHREEGGSSVGETIADLIFGD